MTWQDLLDTLLDLRENDKGFDWNMVVTVESPEGSELIAGMRLQYPALIVSTEE